MYATCMSIDSPEKKFYLKLHEQEREAVGELLNFKTDIKEIYDQLFFPGTRYHIIEEILDKAREYNSFSRSRFRNMFRAKVF